MTKKYNSFIRLMAICVMLCLCLSMIACTGNHGDVTTDPIGETGENVQKTTYTVLVKTEGGLPMEEVGVYIYTDETKSELVWFAKTDAEGKVTFEDVTCESYIAVLDGIPEGFEAEQSYPITGQTTEIVVSGSAEGDLSKITYKLGDMIQDFTVTAVDGTEYTLSELLKEKEAVVLNFWYLECNPCKAEFPYLQAAYTEYADQLEVLAINPVNTDAEAIAAFQTENGLTFPMAVGDPNWAKAMQITGYPTTVVIDRSGNISMIHTGSIDSAETFARIFSFFTDDAYEGATVKSIDELPELVKPGSSADDPIQTGSVTQIEVTLEPGEKVYYQLYRVNGMYLSISNPNAFVEYNGTTYEPSNGMVGLGLYTPDTYTPASVVFGNSGTETVTYTVYLSPAYGSFSNPIGVQLGEFSTNIYAGNDQGVCYVYTATANGVLTLRNVSSSPAGIEYDYTLYNLNSYAQRNMLSDGNVEDKSVSVNVKAGHRVMITIGTLQDSSNNYPAGNFVSLLTFEASADEEEEVVEKIDYTVTVTDSLGAAIPNVNITVDVDGTASYITTDASGVAKIQLPKGTYTATLIVPDGYTAENTAITLSEEAPNAAVELSAVQITMVDYTVTVENPFGEPVSGATVIIGSKVATTDEAGKAVFNLEKGSYTAIVSAADLVSDAAGYAFPEDAAELTVTLEFKRGTVNSPIFIDVLPFVTDVLPVDGEVYYLIRYSGTPILTVSEPNAYVIYNGTTYGADSSGIVTVQMENGHPMMPATIIVGNASGGKTGYTINLVYPEGTMSNPKGLTDISKFTTDLAEGNTEGYFYTWTADKTGNLVFEVTGVTEGVGYDVRVTNQNTSAQKTIDADGIQAENGNMTVTIPITKGDSLNIHVTVLPDEATWTYPAAVITVEGTVVTVSEPDPSEPDPSTTESSEPDPSTTETAEPETSEPETSEPDASTEIVYTVTVVDSEGSPVSGVAVMLNNVFAGSTDETGKVTYETASGTYAVTLAGTDAYYNKAAAVLTANSTELVIKLAAEVDPEKTQTLYNINDNAAYILGIGTTHVELGTGKSYYSAESNSCFFLFIPDEAGTYSVSVDNTELVIASWGTPFNIYKAGSASDNENNALQYSVQDNQVGHVEYVLGIEVVDGIDDAAVTITRIGEPDFDITQVPYDTQWQSDYVPAAFTLAVPEGKSLTYVDIVNGKAEDYVLVLSEEDHFYHLGMADGPVVYVNLGYDAPYVSLYRVINGEGFVGGGALREYFYDESGAFVKKEDYTDCLTAYFECMDATYDVYPLTEDLAYILQTAGSRWWDPTSPECVIENVNQSIAWLFPCCYIPE